MKRLVSVWLPVFAIDRLARAEPASVPADRPFALVEKSAGGIRLTALNGTARRAGLAPGLALADARAGVPGLVSRPAETGSDRAALLDLACWLGRYGPARHVDGADGLWVDVSGVAHLFGGEEGLARDLASRLAGLGFTARLAIADTFAAAHGLARYGFAGAVRGKWIIVPPGGAGEAVAPLPVDGLRLDPDTVVLLKRLGLGRIGQLYGLPRTSLARRFREAGRHRQPGIEARAAAVLERLDQALGTAAEPLVPLALPPRHQARAVFPEPIAAAEPIAGEVERLAQMLARSLAATHEGLVRLALTLYRADGTRARITAATSRPCRSPAHITALLAERLAVIDAGFGIDALVLDALATERVAEHQAALGDGACAAGGDPAELIDRLTARLGADRVSRLAAAASHVPERAVRRLPAIAGGSGRPAEAPRPAAPPRPAFLLEHPEPVEVVAEVPEGAPRRLVWRRVMHRIVDAEGPERIAPEWWRAIGAAVEEGPATVRTLRDEVRDYYRLEDDRGGRYWVFRAGRYGADAAPPRWFLHGVLP